MRMIGMVGRDAVGWDGIALCGACGQRDTLD